jgi:hypothetical protein
MRASKAKLLLLIAAASAVAVPASARMIRNEAVDPLAANAPSVDQPWIGTEVYREDGKYLGADPDARVRFELHRDSHANDN